MIDLSNRVALVTGGSRGIGAATALMLAKAGADVVISYSKNKTAANGIINQISSIGRKTAAFQCNLENYSSCKSLTTKIIRKFKRIDILINSAGIWEYGAITTMRPADWDKTIKINLNGTFNICSTIIPIMRKLKYGRIINVASTAGQRGEAFHSHYAASKGGVIAFTKSIAQELIADGIWVNAVAPGWVDTDMVSHVFKNRRRKREIFESIPRKRIASPEEIAGPIVFLCSDLSNHIVGEILNVNGGSVLS